MNDFMGSIRRTWLIAGVLIVAGTAWDLSWAHAQDDGFRLSIVPESIDVSYNASKPDHHVFFAGEPVLVAIRLINQTREEFVPRDQRPLADLIVKNVQVRQSVPHPGATEAPPMVGWSLFSLPRHPHDGTSPVPSRNYAEMRWSLSAAENGTPLPPGAYEVSARYTLRPDHELSARVVVEVREPQTRADQLDALMHAAIRARWDGQFPEAERLLKQLLGLNPVSAVAYAELAAVYKGTSNCAASQAAAVQALAIVERGADRESTLFASRYALEDFAAGLRGSRLSCK